MAEEKPVFHPTNGREGETATLLSTGLFTLTLRVFGFAPRHLNRSTLFDISQCA